MTEDNTQQPMTTKEKIFFRVAYAVGLGAAVGIGVIAWLDSFKWRGR